LKAKNTHSIATIRIIAHSSLFVNAIRELSEKEYKKRKLPKIQ
jgi:hypothetical protein